MWLRVYGQLHLYHFLSSEMYYKDNSKNCKSTFTWFKKKFKKTQTISSRPMYRWGWNFEQIRGRRGRDRMVVGFITIYAISAYHH